MANDKTVLLVEDSPSLARVYLEYLRTEQYRMLHASGGEQAIAMIREHPVEAVLLDLVLPDMDGMEIMKWIQQEARPISVVIITAHGSIGRAVEAMRLGVYDFLEKPFSRERLIVTLRNALDRVSLVKIVGDMERTDFEGFTGASLVMQSIYRIIDSAAPSKASVFITGESGTGKEVCAQAIHNRSPRSAGPFVAINCAAIPKDLVESEIFGHVKGAFTGALQSRDGAAKRADGGTLFLDELGEMNLDLQAKLLRFIQTGAFGPVGSNALEEVDVRFIAATNRNPLELVRSGLLREDLYYRLHVIPVHLPPLRERGNDVMLIADRFLQTFSREEGRAFRGFNPEARAVLLDYDWPGNVRQLQNVVHNIVVLNDGDEVIPAMLPPPLAVSGPAPPAMPIDESVVEQERPILPLWQVEMEAIERAIRQCDESIPRAADLLGVSPSTLYRKRQAWKDKGLL